MNSYIAFLNKEILESLRTYKFIIMGIIFLLMGIGNPLMAKFIPVLMENLTSQIPGLELDLRILEPTAWDSWAQFFGNIGQIGIIVVVVIYAGIIASELKRGTLINILTKGLKRSTVVIAKFTSAFIVWTVSYIISVLATYALTVVFFESESINNLILALVGLWVFGLFLIALLILGGVLFKKTSLSLLLAGGAIVILALVNIVSAVRKFNPVTLFFDHISLISPPNENPLLDTIGSSDFVPAVIICVVSTILIIGVSIMVFNKKPI